MRQTGSWCPLPGKSFQSALLRPRNPWRPARGGWHRIADRSARTIRSPADAERGYAIGLRLPQVRLENFGEKVVITMPLTLIVKRDEEQIATFQDIQHFFAIFPPSDRIAQGTHKLIENSGL